MSVFRRWEKASRRQVRKYVSATGWRMQDVPIVEKRLSSVVFVFAPRESMTSEYRRVIENNSIIHARANNKDIANVKRFRAFSRTNDLNYSRRSFQCILAFRLKRDIIVLVRWNEVYRALYRRNHSYVSFNKRKRLLTIVRFNIHGVSFPSNC